MQNAFVESFNGSFQDELLNETLFSSLAEACEKINVWKDDYELLPNPWTDFRVV
jgi:putative transposase